ncbi:MAG: diacylglycerol kinase family lipid kinase [Lachnospiraceae bacterium]|nr:diacylglycerol kinase family lipid kinase [Lachnospiraceae bacterium]
MRLLKKKLFFIFNPYAGKGSIKNHLLGIVDMFTKEGYEVTVYPTQKQGDGVEAVYRRGGQYDVIACCGGDGTLDEVVTGMMKSGQNSTILYIPAGSTNDFANSLHLPKNMLRAAKEIVHGEEFQCDIGSFNEDYFVYIAAFGIFTDVSYETKQDMKNVLGHMAYIMEGMKRLSAVKSYQLKITCCNEVIKDEFIFGMITNSESVGGFKRITGEYVELDDGEFEVTLIKRPKSALEMNDILQALLLKDIDTDNMYCFRTNHIRIEAKEEIPWTLDGEFGGRHKQVEINNLKQAFTIMRPKE